MSNQNEFQYIEAKEFLHLPVIEISDAKSFTRFANLNNVYYIFKIAHDKKVEFFFPYGGIVYKIDGSGFLTITDMLQAQNGNFPAPEEFYKAKGAGFSTFDEYTVSQTGSHTKEEYDAANKAGFVQSFDKFKSKAGAFQANPNTAGIPSNPDPVMLHKFSLQKEIKTYDEFEKIYDAGFPDALSFNDAGQRGFTDGKSYFDARQRGFNDATEYKDAIRLGIESKKEYDEYSYLEFVNRNRAISFDQLQLLIALSNCENGEIVSVAKAKTFLEKAQEKLKKQSSDGHKYLPLWYSQGIAKEDKLLEFLKKNEDLKKFGFFNTAKNSFEIFKASAVKIFVDGSNVAYNGTKKPEMKNIRLLIKELNFYKFKDVIVIADASLKHRVKDQELLAELKKECEYLESPANTSADEFLIQSAKREKGYIVSNDKFEEWKKKDKWVDSKISSLRITFIINKQDKVFLNGIEEKREKTVDPNMN